MAAEAGAAKARVGGIVTALAALFALGAGGTAEPGRDPAPEPALAPADPPAEGDVAALRALAARVNQRADPTRPPASEPAAEPPAPLPGAEWNDPDSVNWAEVPAAQGGPLRDRFLDWRGDRGQAPSGRLLERLRGELRTAAAGGRAVGDVVSPDSREAASAGWPDPVPLRDQLDRLAATAAPVGAWAAETLAHVRTACATAGPADPAADGALVTLGTDVDDGITLADRLADPLLATTVRRTALAVARRVAVWRAAVAACSAARGGAGPAGIPPPAGDASTVASTVRLLEALEQFESTPAGPAASRVHVALAAIRSGSQAPAAAVERAVGDHYRAPNVRVAVHRGFLARMLPETTVQAGPMQEFVLGRPVRGTRRVRSSTDVRFVPDPDEIRCELLVDGVVTSRTVVESGPAAIHSDATAEFTVRKPVTVSPQGIAFGHAFGTASNQSRLADIRTDFDALPIMGPLVRSIVRNQVDEQTGEARREVNDKIVSRACREVDASSEPKIRELAARVRKRAWEPLVGLGLEPVAVALETTPDTAAARLRLASARQLAAHTPRPRAPGDALLSVQVHESSMNNACAGLGLAGRRFSVEELVRTTCGRLGVAPRISDDLPGDVEVAFAAEEPLRIECRDGLVHVRMALDSIESGRRSWDDVVAQVAYRPVTAGLQVFLEREGPVRLSGEGQQGRMEIALRTIFGKVFPKERPVPLIPAQLVANPRLAGVQAVQAVSTDGWLAVALAEPAQASAKPPTPTAAKPATPGRRMTRR